MNKIKVGYIIDRLAPGGGTENQLIQLLRNIDREQFTPVIFNIRPESYGTIDLDCERIFFDVESIFRPSTVGAFRKLIKEIKRTEVDLLQIYFYDGRLLGTLAGRVARVRPLVFCRREMGWWYTKSKLFMTQRMASLSDYCMVNANCIKKLVAATEHFPAEKIEVIYNGVDLRLSPPEQRVKKSAFDIPEESPLVGVVSNLRPVKRIDRFIEAASRIRNKQTHFMIIGKGPLQADLERLVEQKGLGGRVHFHYTVDNTHDIISLFDIGVLASESEGLSNVLIEYAMAGVPSVAFNIGGNPEVIADGETGFVVENGDTEAMAARIDRLLENEDIRNGFANKARERAERLFSVREMVKRTEDFYRRISGR